jgi:hypothetical protein
MRGRGPGWVLYLMYDTVVYSSTTSMPWLYFYSILNLRVGWTIIDRILASHGRMLFHRESADNSFCLETISIGSILDENEHLCSR